MAFKFEIGKINLIQNIITTRSAQEIWEAALGELQIQVSKPNYRTWLEKTIGLSYQDNQFVIGVPNTFVAEYLDKNQRSLIEKTLVGLTKQDIETVFRVNGHHHESNGNGFHKETPSPPPQPLSPSLNLRYTFDSFIVGKNNQLAYNAALNVAQNPGFNYNPLFIYGGAGLGKTHLLHAIGHTALANNLNVLYVSAEHFTNEFVNAIRERKAAEFQNKYRSVGMLLIDDIHFILGKEQTEECLFHTFNELHNANRQIAITSDRPPKALSLLQERLRSRFEWGLVAGIQPPDFETRLAILRAKVNQKGEKISEDVLEFIASQAEQNIRQLEGALNRVIAFAKLLQSPPRLELAARALEDLSGKDHKIRPPTPSLIVESVAKSFQLSPLDLKGRKRDKETTLARHVAMYLIRQETNCSLAQIGQELGGRDHATVTHACEKVAANIDSSPSLRRTIQALQQTIHQQNAKKDFTAPSSQ